MGHKSKKQEHTHREEQQANRLIKFLCIGLVILAVLMMVVYSLA